MITKDQILQATDTELPKLAGEVLQDDKYYVHHWHNTATGKCRKCDAILSTRGEHGGFIPTELWNKECSVKNPIPLTWPEAMKWRDWAVEKFGPACFRKAMLGVVFNKTGQFKEQYGYLIAYAQPSHYIRAAMLCVIETQDKEKPSAD